MDYYFKYNMKILRSTLESYHFQSRRAISGLVSKRNSSDKHIQVDAARLRLRGMQSEVVETKATIKEIYFAR